MKRPEPGGRAAEAVLPPEFLNRLDEIVFYKPLTRENITGIIDLLVKDLNRRLEPQELSVRLTPEAKEEIIDRSYDPAFGARPLRRYVQHTVETLIARKLIAGDVALTQCSPSPSTTASWRWSNLPYHSVIYPEGLLQSPGALL